METAPMTKEQIVQRWNACEESKHWGEPHRICRLKGSPELCLIFGPGDEGDELCAVFDLSKGRALTEEEFSDSRLDWAPDDEWEEV